MVAVAEDRAALASHDLVQPLRGADAERLHHPRERRDVGGLDEHVDVVALDGEMGETRVAPLQALVERPQQHDEAPAASQVPDLRPHPHRDVQRLARVDLACRVRHPPGRLLPAALPAAPEPQREPSAVHAIANNGIYYSPEDDITPAAP